jgi:hypothetical protein
MIHVFRGVTFCHWINSSHHFEGNVVFGICGTVNPVPHCNSLEDLNLPSKCHCLSAKEHDHIFQTSNSPWCVVCFSELLEKLYLFLYFFVVITIPDALWFCICYILMPDGFSQLTAVRRGKKLVLIHMNKIIFWYYVMPMLCMGEILIC